MPEPLFAFRWRLAGPRRQLFILNRRVIDAVRAVPENRSHPGDPIIGELDLSKANLRDVHVWSIGSAVLKGSLLISEGSVNWKLRSGAFARVWVTLTKNRPLRPRGIPGEVMRHGMIRTRDRMRKIAV